MRVNLLTDSSEDETLISDFLKTMDEEDTAAITCFLQAPEVQSQIPIHQRRKAHLEIEGDRIFLQEMGDVDQTLGTQLEVPT